MNRQRIAEYLERDGVRYSTRGFHYLREAIAMAGECEILDFHMGEIEINIAKQFGASVSGVDRAMRYAVSQAGHKESNKEYIAKAVDRLNANREFRICTACGKHMHRGYVIGEGAEYYCDDECLSSYYSEEEYDQLCQMDLAYWTDWE